MERNSSLFHSCNRKISAAGAVIYRASARACKSSNHRRSSHAPFNKGLMTKKNVQCLGEKKKSIDADREQENGNLEGSDKRCRANPRGQNLVRLLQCSVTTWSRTTPSLEDDPLIIIIIIISKKGERLREHLSSVCSLYKFHLRFMI